MKEENIGAAIARTLGIRAKQAEATIALLDEGNTVPFISRYRKEATGELDEEQVRSVESELSRLRNLVKRQQEIEKSIEEQGKLTPEIKEALDRALKMQELEDIYLPFKQKRRTRAGVAREKGLEPLALAILAQEEKSGTAEEYAAQFIDAEKGVETAEDALSGAMDIVAETVSEGTALRQKMRKELWQRAELVTALDEEAEDAQTFLMYQDYKEPLRTLPSHRILAINRGEKKGCLKVTLQCDHEKLAAEIFDGLAKGDSIFRESLKAAIEDGYKRLLFPAMERELRALLTENAEKQAIHVFGANLKQLLLEAPLAGHTVMGLDPGYRTGCKMAVVSPTGQVVDHGVLGNGTASYETEEFTASLIRENKLPVHYLITNEAGASVYSASKLAKEELPEYDVTIRGAVSIARRVQDPLAELVKIDPQAIGVGQYQHDVNQKELAAALDAVVESAVNHVGVNLNTASAALLSHIAGVTKAIAKNIVDWRDENGIFASRRQLLKVPRLGPAAFTQCAGFLRIAGGKSPLDNTPVHPESYALTEKLLDRLGFSLADLGDKKALDTLGAKLRLADAETLAKELAAGVPTMRDIIDALKKPGRDPREDLPAPLTRQAIVKLSDIKAGAVMRGTVRNITDFGVFVDIGIKTAGLIHISELSKKRVKHPLDVVSVGDIVNVMVIKVDEERGRIGLSLKQVPKEAAI